MLVILFLSLCCTLCALFEHLNVAFLKLVKLIFFFGQEEILLLMLLCVLDLLFSSLGCHAGNLQPEPCLQLCSTSHCKRHILHKIGIRIDLRLIYEKNTISHR